MSRRVVPLLAATALALGAAVTGAAPAAADQPRDLGTARPAVTWGQTATLTYTGLQGTASTLYATPAGGTERAVLTFASGEDRYDCPGQEVDTDGFSCLPVRPSVHTRYVVRDAEGASNPVAIQVAQYVRLAVQPGSVAKVNGYVRPAVAGVAVAVYSLRGNQWTYAATVKTDAAGRFGLQHRGPANQYYWRYRAVAAATRTNAKGAGAASA